jgi:hypothetical protein
MKFYTQSVTIEGFEMFEALNEDGDQIALAWNEGAARKAAKRYRADEGFDCFDFIQAITER